VTIIGGGLKSTTINGDAEGDVIHVTADWVCISDLKVTNSGDKSKAEGIEIYYSDHCKIENCHFSKNYWSNIELEGSNYTTICNNTVETEYNGIYIWRISNNNTIKDNMINGA
jgi:parallel beta-helix repeat protein